MPLTKPVNQPRVTLNDKYDAFLASGEQSKDNFSNPLNLFDDSNQVDRLWVRTTRYYFSKGRRFLPKETKTHDINTANG